MSEIEIYRIKSNFDCITYFSNKNSKDKSQNDQLVYASNAT